MRQKESQTPLPEGSRVLECKFEDSLSKERKMKRCLHFNEATEKKLCKYCPGYLWPSCRQPQVFLKSGSTTWCYVPVFADTQNAASTKVLDGKTCDK